MEIAVHFYSVWLCVCAPMYVEARREHWVSCSITLCLISLRQSLFLYLELSGWPASFGDPPVSGSHCTGLQALVAIFGFLHGAGHLNSSLHAWAAGALNPLSHLPSPLLNFLLNKIPNQFNIWSCYPFHLDVSNFQCFYVCFVISPSLSVSPSLGFLRQIS